MISVKRKLSGGFTLIELLAVITVILILAAIISPLIGNAMQKAKISQAKVMVEKLEMAVRNYYAAFGQYPDDITYEFLGQKLYSINFGTILPVLEFDPKWVNDGSNPDSKYIDPWGHLYEFYYAETTGSAVEYQNLIVSTSYLGSDTNRLSFVVDPSTAATASLADDILKQGFLIWSKGPDTITGTQDDVGNWGKTRSKSV